MLQISETTRTPEHQLVLACATTAPDSERAAAIRALAGGPLDWHATLAFAVQHRLTPLLYHGLTKAEASGPPVEVQRYLRQSFQRTTFHNLALTAELLRVLRCLSDAGIPAATYKGPLIAATVYGNPALRTYEDLDIIVQQRDLWRAREALSKHDYRATLQLTTREERAYIRQHNDYPLRHAELGIALELQWRVMQEPFKYPRNPATWWQRFVPYTLSGHSVLSLPPEDLLLALCVHGSKHQWQRLNWVVDLAELLRRTPTIDWEFVIHEANRYGARRMLGLGLQLAHKLLGCALPARSHSLIDQTTNHLAARVCQHTFMPDTLTTTVDEEAPIFFIRMHERWSDRLRIALKFHSSLLRPIKIIRKYRQELLHPLLNR